MISTVGKYRVFFAALFLIVSRTAFAQSNANLVGTWQAKEGLLTVVLTLNANGTGKLDDTDIKYVLTDKVLSVDEDGIINKYAYQLSGNKLTLLGGDLAKPMIFERQGTPAAAGLGGRRSQMPSPDNKSANPAGAWETKGPNGAIQLVLKPDGTGTFGGGRVHWEFNQGVLSLTGPNGKTVMYSAVLTQNSFTVSGADLTQPVIFQRATSVPAPTDASGVRAGEENSRSGLVGKWQGPEGIVQINGDGTLLIDNVSYRYTLQGNTLTLIGRDGSLPIPYQLSGNNLTVTMNGQVVTLKRTTDESGPSQTAGSGAGAAELAGKWCYFSSFSAISGGGSMTDECFTINPNGTYTYHREASISAYAPGIYGGTASQTDDSGTVQISGSTLTVISRTQGRSTYNLVKRNNPKNGDPMLCLDGRCYVTYYQRPSWR